MTRKRRGPVRDAAAAGTPPSEAEEVAESESGHRVGFSAPFMRMGEQTHLVFVYGTLRAGFWNRFLLGGAKRAGRGRTSERFALYVGRLPYAIRSEEVHQVVGDLYEVDSRTLTDIDNYKGHPDWYRREMVEVTLEDGTVHSAWMYFYHTRIGKLSPDGAYHPEQPATEAPSRPRFDYLDGFADPPAL